MPVVELEHLTLQTAFYFRSSPSYLSAGVIVRTKLTLSASQILGGSGAREGGRWEVGVGFIVIRCLTTALLTSLLGYFGFIEMTDRLGSSGPLPPSVINKTEHDHLTEYISE